MDGWEPFFDDYVNYSLLHKAVTPSGVDVRILYNKLTSGSPRCDLIDELAIFDVESDRPSFARLGAFSFEDFVAGDY